MKTTLRRTAAIAAALVLLAGCSSGGEGQEGAAAQAPDPGEEDPAPANTSPTETIPATPETAEPAEPEEPALAADDPACLVGDWLITEASMQEFYDSMDTPAVFTVNGDTGLTFEAETYEYTPGFTLDIDINGMGASGTLTGSIAGSWTASGGVITTSNEENDIDLQVTVAGQRMDGTDLGEGFLAMSPINSADFRCEPSGPVIAWQGGSGPLDVHLSPRT